MNHIKTWKREVAVGLLGCLVLMATNALVGDFAGYAATNTIEVLKILAMPFVLFAMGAYGMDAYAKQVNPQPPQSQGDFITGPEA